jgi:hypothetical protein
MIYGGTKFEQRIWNVYWQNALASIEQELDPFRSDLVKYLCRLGPDNVTKAIYRGIAIESKQHPAGKKTSIAVMRLVYRNYSEIKKHLSESAQRIRGITKGLPVLG